MKKLFIVFSVLAVVALMFSSCSKGDDPVPTPKTPLTIVKTTPENGFTGCYKNQTYTFVFSDKIVFDNANFQNYIELFERIATKDFTWKASYDGDKTITITTTNNIYFVFNNEIFWHFKKGMIKTPDGRVLADDKGGDGVYFYFVTRK